MKGKGRERSVFSVCEDGHLRPVQTQVSEKQQDSAHSGYRLDGEVGPRGLAVGVGGVGNAGVHR